MNLKIKHIQILMSACLMVILSITARAENCVNFLEIAGFAEKFNQDNVYPPNAELYRKGDLRILKPYQSNLTEGPKSKIVEILQDRLMFVGFLTLDVSFSMMDCNTLSFRVDAEKLIIDQDTLQIEGNVLYPVHSDRGYKVDRRNGVYIVAGNFREVQIEGKDAQLFEACFTSCIPEIKCETSFNTEINKNQVSFINTSSTITFQGQQFDWDFGDGVLETKNEALHEYKAGVYKACLTVENKMCITPKMTFCKDIEIKEACQVGFTHEIQNTTVQFKSTATIQPENANKFEWDFGDGNVSTSQNAEPVHVFSPGIYQVCLEVAAEECEASSPMVACKEIAISSCLSGDQMLLPNGDGLADFIFVKAGSYIYDRSGYLVFEVHEDVNWTGIDQNNGKLPLGIYTVVCGEGGKFNVTIIR